MKRIIYLLVMSLLCTVSLSLSAANTKKTVTQVAESVEVPASTDYIISDTIPFGVMGSVNITDTDHSVVIIKKIKPSRVIKNWLTHVFINGAQAVDGENCQVKMYDYGAIIFPYSKDIRPLVCYTDKGQNGTSCNDYTEGHSGGYMKTLDADHLNNQIRSFTLKRGYMVTFALGIGGWGYSRCFIADMEDLVMDLPVNMAGRVSSYRLFKWQNAKKGSLASTSETYCDLVNATAGFDWGAGHNMLPDVECIPNHIYEDFPAASVIGSATWSCHSKNNNEPGNSADDTPQTVEVVLDNWQNVMRTGLRLCSESSHDGSMGHIQAFCDSIDARGWRCDIIDLHCYWPASKFDQLTSYSDNYGNGRPIWISEWLWGAWWSKNGIFAEVTDASDFSLEAQKKLLDGTKPILQKLNANTRVERYFYWNAEERTSLWSKDGTDTLSLLGKYFANMGEGLAFNRSNEFIPKVVYRPSSNLTSSYDNSTRMLTLKWNDPNGDMIDSMAVFCKRPGTTQFIRIAGIEVKDMDSKNGPNYTFEEDAPNGTNIYKIAIYPVGSTTPKYSNPTTVLVISDKAEWKDVTADYVVNGGFDESKDFQTANLGKGTANHKVATGWTTPCSDGNGAAGVFKIGSGYTLNGQAVPAKNVENKVSGGALGLSQGWGQENYYTQTLTLPAGTYRMTYAVYNKANTTEFTNLCGYQIGSQSFVYDNITSFTPGKWIVSTLSTFTLVEKSTVTLKLGFCSPGGKSTGNPYPFFDYVKLEQADLTNVDDAGDEIIWLNVDSLLKNNGFDVETDFVKTDVAKGTANHKKATGWTTTSTDGNGASAVFAIGSTYALNGQNAPKTNANGEIAGGALGISQGWSQDSYYTQKVTLPAGTYRLGYAVYNAANASASFSNRCGYKIGTQNAVYDGLSQLAVGLWTTRMMEEFTIDKTTSVTFSVGMQAAGSSSTSNAYLFFDYVTLEKGVLKSEYEKEHATGIESPSSSLRNVSPVAIYNLKGIRQSSLQKGINMVLLSDGTVKKVFIK